MTDVTTAKPEHKLSVPEKIFEDPAEVVHDHSMSWDEKMTALKNWEMDEKAGLTADDENMTGERPAGKPTHSETLEKIQAAERELQESTPRGPEQQQAECGLLTSLLVMNIDACVLYKKAAGYAKGEEQREVCRNLEKLHRLAITDLIRALKKNGGIAKDAEQLYMAQFNIFGALAIKSNPVCDREMIESIRAAEDKCSASMQEGIENKNVSATSQFHLACGVQSLQRRHDYLNTLARLTNGELC